MRINHGVSAHPQDVGVPTGRQHVRDGQRLRRVLVGLDGAAGGDLPDDRQDVGLCRGGLGHQLAGETEADGGGWREPDGTRQCGIPVSLGALQVAVSLQDLEVVVDG